ncbi:MAG: hypothetical protein AAGG50_03100 [Bacteroidota bacterium]
MSYSIERAELVSDQIRRLATQNPFQLAGQYRNLDFWLDEAASALTTLTTYPQRFTRLRDGTKTWIAEHGSLVVDYCSICQGPCELEKARSAPLPKRTSSRERNDAEKGIREAVRLIALRLYRSHFIDEGQLREIGGRFEFDFEPKELRRSDKYEHVEPVTFFRRQKRSA